MSNFLSGIAPLDASPALLFSLFLTGAALGLLAYFLRQNRRLRDKTRRQEDIFNALDAHLAVIDEQGTIIEVNQAWSNFAQNNNGLRGCGIGGNYFESMRGALAKEDPLALRIEKGLRDLLEKKISVLEVDYPCHSPREKRWFKLVATRLGTSARSLLIAHQNITSNKLSEETLKDSESHFHQVADTVPAMIWVSDTECRNVFTNKASSEFTGRSQEQLEGSGWAELIHPDDLKTISEIYQIAFAQRKPFSFEYRYLRHDGEYRHLVNNGRPRYLSNGDFCGYIGACLDLTEQHKSEAALRLLSTALNACASVVVITDATGNIQWLNPAFTQRTGYEAAEVLGKNPRVLKSGIHDPEHYQKLWETILDGKVWRGQVVNRRKDGSTYIEYMSITPLLDASGKITHFIAVKEDVTERHQHLERLREQAELLDTTHEAIFVCALDRKLSYLNRGTERLYEVQREKALSQRDIDLAAMDPALLATAQEQLLKDGNWSGEMKQVLPSGRELMVFCRWTLVKDQEGAPSRILAIHSDFTRQHQMQLDLQRAQRLESVGALASGVAHDINNLLTPILMASENLREAFHDPESSMMLDNIQSCTRRAAAVMKQLLTFARGRPGTQTSIEPSALLRELVKLIQETFPRNIRIDTAFSGDLLCIQGDSTQIHQALLNLCINARDAMPAGGVLTLAADKLLVDESTAALHEGARPGPYVRLLVADTGMGIPNKHLDRIFEPFFTTKAQDKGTGLGLPLVLGVTRGHGGFACVHSKEGRGTRVELFFPAGKNPTQEVPSPPLNTTLGNGERILVVDDESSMRDMIHRTLTHKGYRVLLATDGEVALRYYKEQHQTLRLVITDLMMPRMDGLSLVEALAKEHSLLPILVMTGLSTEANREHLRKLGDYRFLTKPFSGAELLAAVEAGLSRQKLDES